MINHSKKSAVSLILAFALVFATGISVYAADELVPLGRTTGMKFFSEGAAIVRFSPVDGSSPAEEAGLKIGDIVVAVEGKPVYTNEMLSQAINSVPEEDIEIEILRKGQKMTVTCTPKTSNDGKRLIGAYVRDSMAGIGTITYVDPDTGEYGALGHGVSDMDTGELMSVDRGELMYSNVVDVVKGKSGIPGELCGQYDLINSQGTIETNTPKGVFGKITDKSMYEGREAFPVASKDKIVKGEAYILSNVSGEAVEQFSIEIVKIYESSDGDNKDMMIKVTDERLIEKTGGVVQGMSGSPIIQNGKLIGAVTHVLVNDPLKGYAIAIDNMIS